MQVRASADAVGKKAEISTLVNQMTGHANPRVCTLRLNKMSQILFRSTAPHRSVEMNLVLRLSLRGLVASLVRSIKVAEAGRDRDSRCFVVYLLSISQAYRQTDQRQFR